MTVYTVDLEPVEADAPATCDGDGSVMKRESSSASLDSVAVSVDSARRVLHPERLVRPFVAAEAFVEVSMGQ